MSARLVTDVLIKPAGPDCNLACDYCFYSGKASLFAGQKHRMSAPVLESLIAQVLSQPVRQASFGWQGGEPALMGLAFFRQAVELMKCWGRGQAVANGLQTNGTLIDRQWARFLRENRFLTGLSLDGPEHIHNHYRKNHSGWGSFGKAAAAAKLLLDAGVEVNALSVVNDYSARFPEEIYQFHKSLGLTYMQFIPCVEPDPSIPGQAAPYSASAEAYGQFLCKLFDLWLGDFRNGVPTTSIRFFESALFQYAGFPATECTHLPECGTYLLVEHNGDVYACDFFVEPAWKLGNLLETPLAVLLNSDVQGEFRRLKADRPAECQACAWLGVCPGGCPKDRLRNPASAGRSHFCQAYQMFFSHADTALIRLAAEWKRKRGGRPGL